MCSRIECWVLGYVYIQERLLLWDCPPELVQTHQQSVMGPISTHFRIIWLSNSWQSDEMKWFLTAVWMCSLWLPLTKITLCLLYSSSSRHKGRLHLTISIAVRLYSHDWVLANWIWVGVPLILTGIIFRGSLGLVILTLLFLLSSLHDQEGWVWGKNHHHRCTNVEGLDNITPWETLCYEVPAKTWCMKYMGQCLIYEGFFQLRKSSWNHGMIQSKTKAMLFCFQGRAIL